MMFSLQGQDARVRNIFFYITENCNLRCHYCYFKFKNLKHNLTDRDIKSFLGVVQKRTLHKDTRFIISGGEPFLNTPLTQLTVLSVRDAFKDHSIHIQTNGTKLKEDTFFFLKKFKVGLEFGIDGNFSASSIHRKGLNTSRFYALCRHIRLASRLNIPVSATMTVTPETVDLMNSNLLYLIELGLKNIDVTPAAFVEWPKKAISKFKERYQGIISLIKNTKKNYISISEDEPKPYPFFDLSFSSGAVVLPGDVYLCLKKKQKKKLNCFDFTRREVQWNEKNMLYFQSMYMRKFSELPSPYHTYRDYVIASFSILADILEPKYKKQCQNTISLLQFIKECHQELLKSKHNNP